MAGVDDPYLGLDEPEGGDGDPEVTMKVRESTRQKLNQGAAILTQDLGKRVTMTSILDRLVSSWLESLKRNRKG